MNLDPTNEELAVWAAGFMGWHRADVTFMNGRFGFRQAHGEAWVAADGNWSYLVSQWNPTKEGNENQAMMVVRKMNKADIGAQIAFIDALGEPTPSHWGALEWLLWGPTGFGRVILLAAWKAVGESNAD